MRYSYQEYDVIELIRYEDIYYLLRGEYYEQWAKYFYSPDYEYQKEIYADYERIGKYWNRRRNYMIFVSDKDKALLEDWI